MSIYSVDDKKLLSLGQSLALTAHIHTPIPRAPTASARSRPSQQYNTQTPRWPLITASRSLQQHYVLLHTVDYNTPKHRAGSMARNTSRKLAPR